jgi:phosphopantetheinyl transferase (holo-ACP synthase)
MRLDPPADLLRPVLREVTARVTLSRDEFEQFRSRKDTDPGVNDWLFGRIAAKDAVRALWQRRHGKRTYPADLEVEHQEHGRPVVRRRASASHEVFPTVAVAHAEGTAAALATFGPHAGIALARVRPHEAAFDDEERRLLDTFGGDRDEAAARFRCAREAVAGAVGAAGVVRGADPVTGRVTVVLGDGDRLVAWTARDGDLVVATTLGEREDGR